MLEAISGGSFVIFLGHLSSAVEIKQVPIHPFIAVIDISPPPCWEYCYFKQLNSLRNLGKMDYERSKLGFGYRY